MSESVSKPMAISSQPLGLTLWQFLVVKTVLICAFVGLLVYLQGWASRNSYNSENEADFKMGILHGVLMPAAFPGLLAGHDLPIYAPNNTGRNYKIGYILGINTCGTVFFGLAYWGMGRKPRKISTASHSKFP
jgi:hypothetical protein